MRGEVEKANASPPVFFAAPGTPSSFPSPSKDEGMARRKGAAFSQYAPSLPKVRRLSARHPNSLRHLGLFAGVFLTAPGPRFRPLVLFRLWLLGRDPFWVAAPFEPRADRDGPPSASSSQGIVVFPGRSPAPPGGLGGAFISLPQAPHPLPPQDAS